MRRSTAGVGLLALVTLAAPATSAAEPAPAFVVRARNPIDLARAEEVVEVSLASLAPWRGEDLVRVVVVDHGSGRELLAQAVDLDGDRVDDQVVFLASFEPGQERQFELRLGERRKAPRDEYRVRGRFVRERFDDFAWENDRVAFRVYGQALETWVREPLTSSTVDAWSKRTRRLVQDDWYLVDDYHKDHGEGGDFYSAGKSRGCGGNGLMIDGRLAVTKNFRESRVFSNGPIRLVFELVYPEWDGTAVQGREVKRVTLDAGSHFNRFESRYELTTPTVAPARVAGVRKPDGALVRIDREAAFVRTWEHLTRYGDNGWLGCAVVGDPRSLQDVVEAEGNVLLVSRPEPGRPDVHWAGIGWSGSGDFPDAGAWDRHVDQFVRRLRAPLEIQVGAAAR